MTLAFAFFAAASRPDRAAASAAPAQAWLACGRDSQLTNFVQLCGLTRATAHRLKKPGRRSSTARSWRRRSMRAACPDSGGQERPARRDRGRHGLRASTEGRCSALEADLRRRNATRTVRHLGLQVDRSDRHAARGPLCHLGRRLPPCPRPPHRGRESRLADSNHDRSQRRGVRLGRSTSPSEHAVRSIASYCDAPGADGVLANGRLVAVNVDRAAEVATFDTLQARAISAGSGAGAASPSTAAGARSTQVSEIRTSTIRLATVTPTRPRTATA